MGAFEKHEERIKLLKKYYDLTDGKVAKDIGWQDEPNETGDTSDFIFKSLDRSEEYYSDEVPYLAQKGYLEFRKSSRDNVLYYSITSKTVDLIERIELGMPLAEFENDFSPISLKNSYSLLYEDNIN